jgi:hypothetical protein
MNTEDFNNTVPNQMQVFAFESFFMGMYLNMEIEQFRYALIQLEQPTDKQLTVREAFWRQTQIRCARNVALVRGIK